MNVNFLTPLLDKIKQYEDKDILILLDDYFSFDPYTKNISINEILKQYQINKTLVITEVEIFYPLTKKSDLIVDIFFSTAFVDFIFYFNKLLKISKVGTKLILLLPYSNFTNYSLFSYNPMFFNYINQNGNFSLNDVKFINNTGNVLKLKSAHIKKIFSQSSVGKNQSVIDLINKNLSAKFDVSTMVFDIEIMKTELIQPNDYFLFKRQPSYLSGHSLITHIDEGAVSFIFKNLNIKSFVDIGCGPGGVVNHIKNKFGIEVLGIDGDNQLIRENEELFHIHDYNLGPMVLDKKFDLGWCVEFVEHVPMENQKNYFETFRNIKYLFMTFAPEDKAGYNHVNCQNEEYWINALKKLNFELNLNFTKLIRNNSSLRKDFVRNNGLFFENKSLK
jgi:2-polyprenyl-3-methyl-5-hydroxy-6-metoxy-1,4-benzoquinol methylase